MEDDAAAAAPFVTNPNNGTLKKSAEIDPRHTVSDIQQMHNRNSGEELANRSQPEVPPTTTTTSIASRVEPDVCVTVRDDPIPLCATNKRLQTGNLLQQCRPTTNNKDRQRTNSCCACYTNQQQHQHPHQALNDHEQVAEVNSLLNPSDHPVHGQTKTKTTSSPALLRNCNDLKRAAVDKLQVHYSACHLDNCVGGCRENHPSGVIPTKYQVLGGHEPQDSVVAAAVCRHHHHRQQQQQATTVGEGFQCKFNMMNGNLHLKSSDARAVAMETFDSNAPCATTASSTVGQQQHQQASLVGQQQLLPNLVHHHVILNGLTDKNSLNEQQQMLEQLNGMSINERRFVTGFGSGGKNGGSGGSMLLTPRITLTSADDMDDGHHCDDMMMEYELNDSGPLSPNFLAVPKLQEVGKERRPPVMVKSV